MSGTDSSNQLRIWTPTPLILALIGQTDIYFYMYKKRNKKKKKKNQTSVK